MEKEGRRGGWGDRLGECFTGVADGDVDENERAATGGGSRAFAEDEEVDLEMEEDDVVAGGGALREEAVRGEAARCEGE